MEDTPTQTEVEAWVLQARETFGLADRRAKSLSGSAHVELIALVHTQWLDAARDYATALAIQSRLLCDSQRDLLERLNLSSGQAPNAC